MKNILNKLILMVLLSPVALEDMNDADVVYTDGNKSVHIVIHQGKMNADENRNTKTSQVSNSTIKVTTQDIQALEKSLDITAENSQAKTLDLIYPDTKWCGVHNIANNYSDLGLHKNTDMCCRDHDNCTPCLPALINYRLFPWFHCNCDTAFHRCLKTANNTVSNQVGNVFFNILNPLIKCYRDTNETRCIAWSGWWWKVCKQTGTVLVHKTFDNLPY